MALLARSQTEAASFVQARWFTAGRPKAVRAVVIHTAELVERSNSAENLASYFARGERKVSTHWCVDNNSVVQCVRESDTAYGAPGANEDGIQIELTGFAGQTASQWRDSYSVAMLDRAAQLAAEICHRHGLPAARLLAADLKRSSSKGITGHSDVVAAFKRSTHSDPGVNFPWSSFLAKVRTNLNTLQGGGTGSRVLRAGSRGPGVTELQRLLLVLGYDPGPADGIFGGQTTRAVMAFQSDRGLTPDGVVGPTTNAELTAPTAEPWPGRVLKYRRFFPSMRGEDAKSAQRRLNELGYNVGAADGIFGQRSDTAVRAFQNDRRLSVDGQVGRQTWDAMFSR